jgi:hypothetical protein
MMKTKQSERLEIPWSSGNYTAPVRFEAFMVIKVINILRQSAMSMDTEFAFKALNS